LRLALSERRQVVVPVAPGDTSMEPLLRGGDAVLAGPIDGGVRQGDLVLFRQQDYLVVHRYLGTVRTNRSSRCLRTRGDGRSLLDPALDPGDVRARVIAIRRRGRWLSVTGPGALLFARLVAWHALVWSAVGIAARGAGLDRAVAAVDSGLLRIAVALAVPLLHRRIEDPAGDSAPKSG